MLANILLNIKRKRLMRLFMCFDIKHHAGHLGKAMADERDDFHRKYHHEKLREGIQKICEKRKIKPDDLRLIEDELNEYINGLVNKAHDEESQKVKVREFVDNRIKIKRVDSEGLNGNTSVNELEPKL
ncbi:MAG: hypothetical protein OXG85_06995 [Chloroflexi bacterium]|nr:hypothetical protein [Chloroflexota bacterium]